MSEADDFTLDVRYILTGMLEGRDLDRIRLQSFSAWMHPITKVDAGYGAASKALGQSAAPEVWLPDASELLPQFERLVDRYSNTKRHQRLFRPDALHPQSLIRTRQRYVQKKQAAREVALAAETAI